MDSMAFCVNNVLSTAHEIRNQSSSYAQSTQKFLIFVYIIILSISVQHMLLFLAIITYAGFIKITMAIEIQL